MTDTVFSVAVSERQLFLDDHGIEEIRDLQRTLHQPEKKGAVIEPEAGEASIQIRSAPAWDPEVRRYRLWFTCEGSIGLAESADGLDWERPVLWVRAHKGSLDNSLVAQGPAGSTSFSTRRRRMRRCATRASSCTDRRSGL